MAYTGYGAKYTLTFSDIFQNTTAQYIATIYRKGYSGAIVELDGNSSPLVIETDSVGGNGGYRPVIATKASLNLVIADVRVEDEWTDNTNIWELYNLILGYTGFDFTEFITAESDTFLLEVKKKAGGSYNIIWQGYYIYNTDVSLNEIMPIQFSLQFSDVLQMKSNRFYNFEAGNTNLIRYFPSDKISLLDIIMRCCYFSYITNTVSLEYPFPYSLTQSYLDGNGNTVNLSLDLSSLYIQKNAFLQELGKYKTLFEVLEGVCSQFGLIAFFKDNKLHVKSYDALVNNTTGSVSTAEYTTTYYDDTTDTVMYSFYSYSSDYDPIRPLNSGSFKNIGRDQVIRFNYPIENITLSNSASFNYNTPNNNMSSVSQLYYSGGIIYSLNSWYSKNISGELVQHIFDINDGENNIAAVPFSAYALYKTGDTLRNWATRFRASQVSGFNINDFIDSEEFDVSSGDIFAFSYSAFLDGRFKNLSPSNQILYRPKAVVALVLIAKDGDGNDTEYYYNYTNNKFESTYIPTGSGSLPLITITNYNGTDADKIYYNIKAELNIPDNAKLKIRQYHPYRTGGYFGAPDSMQLFVECCNLQTFKGSTLSGIPSSQKFISKFDGLINSDESVELKSNVFLMDATKYIPTSSPTAGNVLNKNPIFVPMCYGNNIYDAYNSPAAGISLSYSNPTCISISYTTLKNKLKSITSSVLNNIGLNNVTIEGTFKSDASWFIGSKFSYQIIGYDSINFALLDYTIDFKNGTYNALLYSSEFTDATGKTVVTQTVIS
jgi:hypothetical protein